MAWDIKPIKRSLGDPVPQGFNPATDEYEVAHITKNALWQVLVDPNTGQFLGLTDGKINVKASELETILSNLDSKLAKSYACLSTEPKPAGQQNDTLLEKNITTGETKVYKFISSDWREL